MHADQGKWPDIPRKFSQLGLHHEGTIELPALWHCSQLHATYVRCSRTIHYSGIYDSQAVDFRQNTALMKSCLRGRPLQNLIAPKCQNQQGRKWTLPLPVQRDEIIITFAGARNHGWVCGWAGLKYLLLPVGQWEGITVHWLLCRAERSFPSWGMGKFNFCTM